MSEFDGTHPLDEGLDLTSTFGSYAAALTQAIREAKPSTLYGFIIASVDTPPTSGDDAWRKRCLWLKTDVDPQQIYYYNGTSWELLQETFSAIDVKDGAITLTKFSPAMGNALQIFRKNAGNTGFEFVNFASLFNADFIEHEWLKVAFEGATLVADSDGKFGPIDLEAKILELIGTSEVSWEQLTDSPSTAAANQVPYFTGPGVTAKLAYPDQLLRNNQVAPNKIGWGAANAGKVVVIGAGGTDISPQDINTILNVKIATISVQAAYTPPANANGQALIASSTGIIQLNTLNDPSGIVAFVAPQFTLAAGKYRIDLIVPLYSDNDSLAENYEALKLQLYSVTGGVALIERGVWLVDDSFGGDYNMSAVLSLAAETKFEVRVLVGAISSPIYAGFAVNLGTGPEIYTQVMITKIMS